MSGFATLCCGFILVVLAGRAWWVMRQEGDARPRGVEPGEGHVEIESQYFSGLGGGSHQITRVPRDPQEYARAFVPRKERR